MVIYHPTLLLDILIKHQLLSFCALTSKNGKLALGPLDVIYAAELTHSNSNHYGFDLQDTIILVRFHQSAIVIDFCSRDFRPYEEFYFCCLSDAMRDFPRAVSRREQ